MDQQLTVAEADLRNDEEFVEVVEEEELLAPNADYVGIAQSTQDSNLARLQGLNEVLAEEAAASGRDASNEARRKTLIENLPIPDLTDMNDVPIEEIFKRLVKHLCVRAVALTRPHATQYLTLNLPMILEAEYEGSGDSGGVEHVEGLDSFYNDSLPYPELNRRYRIGGFYYEVSMREGTIEDYMVSLAYTALSMRHPGWENDSGARGRFTVDVKAMTATLHHTEFFTESHDTSYDF